MEGAGEGEGDTVRCGTENSFQGENAKETREGQCASGLRLKDLRERDLPVACRFAKDRE